jgi:bifunctional non-homologous end joining protein LigD
MSRVVKRSPLHTVKSGASRRTRSESPLPRFIPPQLSQPVEKPPSGTEWLHEIKLDGFPMAARIDNGRVLTSDQDRARLDRQISGGSNNR